MSQHTPGPWTLSNGWRPTLDVVDTQNVYGAPPSGVVAKVVMASQDGIYSEERKANARLISQAPAMREVLQVFFDAYKAHPERLGASSAAMRHFEAARAILRALEGV